MFEKSEGALQNIAGRVQEAFGKVTGDNTMRVKGRARRIVGGAQYGYGDVANRLRASAMANPIGTIAVVGGICFLLGAVWANKSKDEEYEEN